ncbi:MAG: hypothetical protein ABIJ61_08190 [bacterium]
MNPVGFVKKAFMIFKKKSAKADAGAPKPDHIPFEKDDNVVLVFGHSNAGKTVYFSVLYELLKSRTGFKLSPLDNPTAAALIEGYNLMRGKQIKIKEGRQVEVDGERKFPTMTSETRVLKFGLDTVSRKGIKFYTVDYKGETLSIAEPGELRAKFAQFFPYCRAALFFIDASVLDTDVLLREQIAAFQTIIHDLRDCIDKKVPIGIVITKSDFLDGYSTSNPVELVSGLGAIYKGRRQEAFTRGVTKVNRRRFGEIWGRTSERITRTLGDLIDSMVSYNLDFQFFVVSATGGLAKKQDGGVEPPPDLRPYGIEVPLIWAFKRIIFNKRKYFWWHKVKWIIGLCILWAVIFSAVNLWHTLFWTDDLTFADDQYYKKFVFEEQVSRKTADQYQEYFNRYLRHWAITDFFGALPTRVYANLQRMKIETRIDSTLVETTTDDTETSGGGGGAAGSQASTDTRTDYNQIVAQVERKPLGERKALYEQEMAKFWSNLGEVGDDSTSVSKALVSSIEARQTSYHEQWEAFNEPIAIVYEITGLAEGEKVTMQVGGGNKVDFTNYGASDPGRSRLENEVTGRMSEELKFWHLNFGTETKKEQTVDDPLTNFYPLVRAGQAFRLHFEADLNIYIKFKDGYFPKEPELRKL